MSTKTRTGTVILDDESVENVAGSSAFDDANDMESGTLIEISEEIRSTSGVIVQVVRQEPREYQGHVADMTPGEFSAQKVADLYGPGVYRIRFIGPNKRFLPGGGQLRIAPKRIPGNEPQRDSGGDMRGVLELFERRDRDERARRQQEEQDSRTRRDRWVELGLAALPGIANLVGAMKGGNSELTSALVAAMKPQPAPQLSEIVATMQGLKDLSGSDKGTDAIDQLSRLLTVAKDLSGGGEGGSGSNWVDLVRDGLKAAPELLAGMQRNGPQMVPVQVHSAPVAPQPVQPVPTLQAALNTPPAEGADMLILIQPILRDAAAKIETWAKDGKNAALRAEVLLDDLPQWLADRLKPQQALEFLNHPQWWEHLIAFHPPLAQYRAWIDELRGELIELVREQLQPKNEDETDAPGDHSEQ